MKINFETLIRHHSYLWDKHVGSKMSFVWSRFKRLFTYKWSLPNALETDILFVHSMQRNDYQNFIDTIFSSISGKKKKVFIEQKRKMNIDFLLELSLKEYVLIWKSIKEYGRLKKLYIFLNLVLLFSLSKYIKNYNIKVLIVHADMQPIENFMVQYFKSIGVKTVTLQHGLYIDYTNFSNINEVNYKNVVSDYFLAWGEETKRLIQKYHPKCKIEICGNPVLEDKKYIQSDFFVLIFEQELLKEYNYKLLEIGREIESFFGIKLKVKFHPRNVFKDYSISRDEVVKFDTVYGAKFALGHTSTMMYQMMRLGIPTFKLASSIPCNVINQRLVFHNVDELKKLVEQSQSIDFKEEGKFYIQYLGEESLHKYTQFFQRLMNEKY